MIKIQVEVGEFVHGTRRYVDQIPTQEEILCRVLRQANSLNDIMDDIVSFDLDDCLFEALVQAMERRDRRMAEIRRQKAVAAEKEARSQPHAI